MKRIHASNREDIRDTLLGALTVAIFFAAAGYLERAEKMRKDIEKVHKEMWDAIKDQNDDAYRALANELTRASSALAAEWITVSVLGKIAVEMTDE